MKTIAKRITVLLVALAVSVTFVPTVGSIAAYAGEEGTVDVSSEVAQTETQSETMEAAENDSNPAENDFDPVVSISSAYEEPEEIISLEEAEVIGIDDQIYTGEEIILPVEVELNGDILVEGTDYKVQYLNNQGPGTAQVTIIGIGNYTGEIYRTFEITCNVPEFQTITDTGSGFQLKWTAVPGAEKYRIYKKIGDGKLIAYADTAATSYFDKSVESGVVYAYSICCLDNQGNEISEYDSVGTEKSYTIALGPGRISQISSGILNFTVAYQKVSGAKGYEVRYALNPDMSGSVVKNLGEGTTSLNVSSADEGIYFVQVRPYTYDYTGKIIYGSWSSKSLAKYVRYDIGVSEATLQSYISGVKSNQSIMAILYAFSRVGYPYSQTKRLTGDYYDCSSLVWYAWDSAGIKLTDDWVGTAAAEGQALTEANRLISVDQLMPGSLLFFSSGYNGRYKNITHVAMCVGNNMVVEAAGTKTGVVFRELTEIRRASALFCADPINGGYWAKVNGEWHYYVADVMLRNGWAKDSTGWCYLDANGNMVRSSWITVGGARYYMDGNGYMVSNKWLKEGGKWRYLGSNGKATTNKWVKSGSSWYYLMSDGYMAANTWAKDSIGWCWMNGNGNITRNKWIKVSGEWYYLKSNGYMAANEWKKDSHGWCWMNGSGKIAKNKWVKWNGSWYYLKSNGYMASYAWAKDSAGWCYLGSGGKMVKSQWVESGGKWYYMNSAGHMVTGTQRIGGKTYRFDSSGKWIS